MKLAGGVLTLTNIDLDHIQSDINKGSSLKESLDNQVTNQCGIEIRELFCIRFSNDALLKHSTLIQSIGELIPIIRG